MNYEVKKLDVRNGKLTQEIAIEELEKWLSFRTAEDVKISISDSTAEDEKKKENDAVEKILHEMMKGTIVITESYEIIQQLKFPIKDENGTLKLDSLKYIPRLTAGQIAEAMKGVSEKDMFQMFIGYGSVLTGELRGLIKKLDQMDFATMQTITGFFL